ncbi:MAG: hypothetical protein Alis3KO_03550 [Aliiglaciecola sp.]
MKLKEFEFWAYKLPNEKARLFHLFSRSVCAHFERHFEKIETDGIYRIIIKISDSKDRLKTTEESSSVLKYYQLFDFESFYKNDETTQKQILLDFLYASLLELCEKNSWNNEPFERAYKEVVNDGLINSYIRDKKFNRGRDLCASIKCEHETDVFRCFLQVNDKVGNEVFLEELFTSEPDEFFFNSKLGKLKWTDRDTVTVIGKDKSELNRFVLR